MTITYTINAEERTVITKVMDVVDASQIEQHQHKLGSDPGFQPDMFELMDCMELTDVKLNTIVITSCVKKSPWANGARRAIVVPNPRIYEFLRLFQAFMSSQHGDISIFHNHQSANEWITAE